MEGPLRFWKDPSVITPKKHIIWKVLQFTTYFLKVPSSFGRSFFILEGPVNYHSYLVKKVKNSRFALVKHPDRRLGAPRFWKVLFGRSFGAPRFWKVHPDSVFWVWKVLLGAPRFGKVHPDCGLEGLSVLEGQLTKYAL